MAAPLRRARKLFVRAEDVLQQIVDSSDEELSPFEDEDESQDQDYQPQVRRNSHSSISDHNEDEELDKEDKTQHPDPNTSMPTQSPCLTELLIANHGEERGTENSDEGMQTQDKSQYPNPDTSSHDTSEIELPVPELPVPTRNQEEGKRLSRKRRRNQDLWKKSKTKALTVSGKEHTNWKGKIIPAKSIKNTKDCSKFSQKKVYNVHTNKTAHDTPKPDGRGTNTKKGFSEEVKGHIRRHIKSFPVVESHYCRADSKKQYLEAGLSITKIYELYVEFCSEQGSTVVGFKTSHADAEYIKVDVLKRCTKTRQTKNAKTVKTPETERLEVKALKQNGVARVSPNAAGDDDGSHPHLSRSESSVARAAGYCRGLHNVRRPRPVRVTVLRLRRGVGGGAWVVRAIVLGEKPNSVTAYVFVVEPRQRSWSRGKGRLV
ncbi:hypothetical protein RRG08_064210 [Elysia crispata]|uniref:Uncharacterized protein n=2 Tax=Elysia crispata TaxID=231223 RepID=A0AAE1E3S7_9GAST|nr:hypothetical protein RRG08_064210 [Elysia crispata]